jgi:2-polyprenyl-3-methyl-5-hydroxy-6-metoxy-1,4-benzoquinol methylase
MIPSMAGVSSQFDYEPVRELEGFVLDPERCTARDLGFSRAATSRVVLVRKDGRVAACRTTTDSFADEEIREVVHECGQLYLDVSGRPAIHDFRADVRQLRLTDACRSCPDLPACVACYEPAASRPFDDDEAWLDAWLASAEGAVLDVGMGRLPYLAALADRIRDGRVEYHGLDPDRSAIDAARASGLPLVLHEGGVEGFEAPRAFDRIVAIRSLNHFADVERALSRLAACLAPGGLMLLVESLALPLVRGRRQAARCHEVAEGGFQHLRNWSSHRTISALRGLPLRVTFHRPVGRDTCDQWILEAAPL